jgi:hypothetical protein
MDRTWHARLEMLPGRSREQLKLIVLPRLSLRRQTVSIVPTFNSCPLQDELLGAFLSLSPPLAASTLVPVVAAARQSWLAIPMPIRRLIGAHCLHWIGQRCYGACTFMVLDALSEVGALKQDVALFVLCGRVYPLLVAAPK